jgi:hypothetical protein
MISEGVVRPPAQVPVIELPDTQKVRVSITVALIEMVESVDRAAPPASLGAPIVDEA